MSIKTSIPSNTRKPGRYFEFDVTSAARGLAPIDRRVALIGARLTAGTVAAGIPTEVSTETDADTYWGKGSELALMCRAAMKAGKKLARKGKKPPALWALALADPAGVKADFTFTVTGPATAAGDVVFRIAGRTLRAGVANAASATVIAAAMKTAVDQMLADLPVTGAAAIGVLTVTANNVGVNGNDIDCSVMSAPAGVTVVAAAGVAGTGSYDTTASLDILVDKQYHAVAIANHLSADVSDLKAHNAMVNAPGFKAFTIAYLAEIGSATTANALAVGANQMDVVLVSAEDCPNLTGEIAAQVAVTVEGHDDPAANLDGTELDLYPPPAASVPTATEIETAIAAGALVLGVNDSQDQMTIVRAVTTKTAISSVPFYNVLDLSNPRSLFYVATQVDIAFAIAFAAAKQNARTRQAAEDVVYRVLKSCEELEIVHHVDDHKGEIAAETDPVVPTRINVAIPASVIANLHQLASVVTLFVEG